MQLSGIHHLTAVSADAPGNLRFYTKVLGLRLVKKTVNQDDTSAYHLFYADGIAAPGTDITFFDFPTRPERRGNNTVTRTGMRVAGDASLRWWRERVTAEKVKTGDIVERDDRLTLDFEDPEGQRLALVDDGGAGEAHPWAKSPVPTTHQIRGLGPIVMTVPELKPTDLVLTRVMNMKAGIEPRPRARLCDERRGARRRTTRGSAARPCRRRIAGPAACITSPSARETPTTTAGPTG